MAHKSYHQNRQVVLHDTYYIAHQFQDQKVEDQGHRPTNADTKCAISSER